MMRTGMVCVCVLTVGLAGCSKPPGSRKSASAGEEATPQPKLVTAIPAGEAPKPATPPARPQEKGPDVKAFALGFLQAVQQGQATPEQLTPAFKRIIAEPVFASDQELGYSDGAAHSWLQHYQGRLPGVAVRSAAGDANTQVLLAGGTGEVPYRCLVRLVRVNNAWLVDGFTYTSGLGPVDDLAWPSQSPLAAYAALAFLDSLVSPVDRAVHDRLAAGLMTAEYRATLAPPLPSDKQGYNRGMLASRLRDLRGQATRYQLTRIEGTTAQGTFQAGNKAIPFTLTLQAGDRPGVWQVQSLQRKD